MALGALTLAPARGEVANRSTPRAPHPVTYFPTPSIDARPFWIAVGPDGNLWFTEDKASRIGRITPAGVITEFKLGVGSKQPYAIVAGADGNLWFTERTNNKIGVMDTQGHLLHEYAVLGNDPQPAGITAAPNGDIWFTEMGLGEEITDDVGRVHPDGIITTYHLYDCACFPIGITTGPDGNLWAAEEEGVYNGATPGTVDSITPHGDTITRYPIPVGEFQPGHLPAFIAPGPDGNLWFTEYAADLHLLGRITTGGVIGETPLPGTNTNSIGVVTGPDGRLWVTQGDGADVVLLKTNGDVVTTIPTHPLPAGITVGPDGNMWFGSVLDSEVGRIRAARPGFAYVLDIAPGFVPAQPTVPMDTTVEWVLEAPGMHGAQDATELGLYDSGLKPPVSFLQFTFRSAGTFPFVDPATGNRGRIAVSLATPATGQVGQPFHVDWSAAPAPSGLAFDVQIQTPGSATWHPWQTGVAATGGDFTPNAAGSYAIRARLRGAAGASQWSPASTGSVS